jgi:2Fe-2S ferredoxin
MITLQGRRIEKQVASETGMTILDLALKHEIDWGFSCTRGTCARCRCKIEVGAELLSEPTDAEIDRLGEEEISQGYRLGCQAELVKDGELTAKLETYF